MSDFNSVYDYVHAYARDGQVHRQVFAKTSLPILVSTPLGGWADCSMGAGVPRYNAYVGEQYNFTVLSGYANNGIYTGPRSNTWKYLAKTNLIGGSAAQVPSTYILCDYLGFYPLVDCDSTDEQIMINNASLTRYADGEGVIAMAVSTVPQIGNGEMVIYYTNSKGQSERVMRNYLQVTNIGQLNVNGGNLALADCRMPFLPLGPGDTGIRSIDKVQLITGAGGFINIVLIKPLTTFCNAEIQSCTEVDYLMNNMPIPQIHNDAYLNFIASFGGTPAASSIIGHLIFVRT